MCSRFGSPTTKVNHHTNDSSISRIRHIQRKMIRNSLFNFRRLSIRKTLVRKNSGTADGTKTNLSNEIVTKPIHRYTRLFHYAAFGSIFLGNGSNLSMVQGSMVHESMGFGFQTRNGRTQSRYKQDNTTKWLISDLILKKSEKFKILKIFETIFFRVKN